MRSGQRQIPRQPELKLRSLVTSATRHDGSNDKSRMSGSSRGDDDERQLSSTAYNSQAASTLLSPTTLHASTPHSRFSAHSNPGKDILTSSSDFADSSSFQASCWPLSLALR